VKLLYKHQSALFGTIQARRQGGALGAYAPPKQVKCKIKNTDTVHNAPCVEERSTFIQNTPYFPLFLHPPFPTFLQKHLPIFHIFTKRTPISFPAYGPAILSTTAVMKSVIKINVAGNYVFSCHTINNKSGNG